MPGAVVCECGRCVCVYCDEVLDSVSIAAVAIAIDDDGLPSLKGAHRECMFRAVMGSAQHIRHVREHGDCGPDCSDDKTLTVREQARAAWAEWFRESVNASTRWN